MVAFLPLNKLATDELVLSKTVSIEDMLVEGIKAGHKDSIDKLYIMYSSSLMGIISRIVKFDEIAEDVLQDTFMKIWKSINLYDSSKGRLFTWMANLAKNTAIDQVRSKHYSRAIMTDNIEDSVNMLDNQNQFLYNPENIGIRELTLNLKNDQKEIINLFYFEGYTQSEVAEELNIPLGTVKTKIRLSILALRKYFNETNISFQTLIA